MTQTSQVLITQFCFLSGPRLRSSEQLRSQDGVDQERLDAMLEVLRNATIGEQDANTDHDASHAAEDDLDDGLSGRLPSRINRRRNHKQDQLNVLTRWFNAHKDDPYPSPEEKFELARMCHMEVRQIEHWFTNRRKRHWSKPGGLASPDTDAAMIN
jgi:hypothetical protein